MGTPVPQSLVSPITLALDRMVAAGALAADPLQSEAARALDRVADPRELALFVTPVAYSASTIAKTRHEVIVYAALNPLVPVIEGLRDCVLLGKQPDWTLQIVGGISALIVLFAGYGLFKRLETGIADIA